MEKHVSWITLLLNKWFGAQALVFLHALHIHPTYPDQPIRESFVMEVLSLIIVAAGALYLKSRLSVDRPGGFQQSCELLVTNPLKFGIRDLLDENVPHHAGRKFIPFVGSVSVFVLINSLLGVIPAFSSPTTEPTVPLGCALITFFYFNYQGVRANGVGGYLKQFAGPDWILSPLLFPVEIISTTARVLSLTVRLWANIFASELIYLIFLGLFLRPMLAVWDKLPAVAVGVGVFPATIPIAFIGLHIFVAVVQTYVFTVLPSIYLGMAVSHQH